ncbi:MAG: class I SAM-dependent methyltransferase, partial [Alphaproteobacteria bacterium]
MPKQVPPEGDGRAHGRDAGGPLPWVVRHAHLIPRGGPILDLACGAGRHTRFFLARGCPVTAVDIDTSGLADIAADPRLEALAADLESAPWPLRERVFAAVVATNYLWRPLFEDLVRSVATGGLLLYETFAQGNERYGRPKNPDFLLRPGELLEVVRGRLQVVAYENGLVNAPDPAVKQRLCAVRREEPVPLRERGNPPGSTGPGS